MLERKTEKREPETNNSDMIPITHPIAQEYIMKCFQNMLDVWEELDKEGKIGLPTYMNMSHTKTTMQKGGYFKEKVIIENKEYELIYKSSLCEVEKLNLLCQIHTDITVEPADEKKTFGNPQMVVYFTYNGLDHSCLTSISNWNRDAIHDTIDNCTLFLYPLWDMFHIMVIGVPVVQKEKG